MCSTSAFNYKCQTPPKRQTDKNTDIADKRKNAHKGHVRLFFCLLGIDGNTVKGNSLDKLHHPRSDAYSAQQVLLNKQQIWCGGAYLDCYRV